eukprot:CAMPEP_0172498138 /NCGR_PEP_ID=MMETSP1066-20121228/109777_1 /TAXON_ID=671091 /ORGANISM="Coscinodiscus wailesii, Strain CCMP2513" /LENGTH=425 /DNA_ID=CAMNT_0013271293 /DNA_START=346 /DNA_END=1620 /DNA_ORIENTATION=+
MPGAQISSRFLVVLVSIGIYCISNKSCDGFLMPHNTIPFSVKSIGPIDFTPTTGTRGSTSPIERDHNNVRCRTSFIPSWLNVGAESDDGFSVATVTGDEESEERERDENNDSDEDMVSRIEKYLSDSSSEEASVVSDDILDETERVVSDLISLGSQRGVTTAEKLLWHLVEEKERGNERAHPTIDLFNTVLYAHATLSSTPVDSALSLLTHLETHPSTTPTLHTYNTALSTLSHHSRRYRFADKKAMRLFETMSLPPDGTSYTHLVTTLARSRGRGAAARATKILKESLFRSHPSNVTVATVNTVLTAWSKSDEPDAPDRAAELLGWMSSSVNLVPDAVSFTAVIDAFCQRKDWRSVTRGEGMLNEVISLYLSGESDVAPDKFCFTIVMSAYCKLARRGRSRDAAKRAGRLLARMERLSEEGREG